MCYICLFSRRTASGFWFLLAMISDSEAPPMASVLGGPDISPNAIIILLCYYYCCFYFLLQRSITLMQSIVRRTIGPPGMVRHLFMCVTFPCTMTDPSVPIMTDIRLPRQSYQSVCDYHYYSDEPLLS